MDCNSLINSISSYLAESKASRVFSVDNVSYIDLHKFIHNILEEWKVMELGQSFLGRKIYGYTIGNENGQRVLLWSQMHGNEPGSTIALVMFMEYLNNPSNPWVNELLSSFYIMAIPMLNPDGSEIFIRRNAQWIDINRDARRQITAEAQILIKTFEEIKPKYCFNLHDQEIYYSPSDSDKPTALALLSPSADYQKSITPARKEAMDILGYVISCLKDYPIAKYNDEFMPSAFGDYFSSKNAVTMLFETGYIIGDETRAQTVRLHSLSLILALLRIIHKNEKTDFMNFYKELPFNKKNAFFDFIMRNVILQSQQQEFIVDIAINRDRLDPDSFVNTKGDYFVYDIGDLQDKKAFREKDFNHKLVLPAEKIFMYSSANWLINYF